MVTWDGGGDALAALNAKGEALNLEIIEEFQGKKMNLGGFYNAISSYINLEPGMTMGLASYGNYDGKYFSHLLRKKGLDCRSIMLPSKESYLRNGIYVAHSPKLINRLGPRPKKPIDFPIPQRFADIAAETQHVLEKKAMEILDNALEKTGTPNLCLAGGVALNSVLNGKIGRRDNIEKIYVTPNPGDAGTALGAAFVAHVRHGGNMPEPMEHSYWGPSFSSHEIKNVLHQWKLSYEEYGGSASVVDDVMKDILDGKVVGWFQGRAEWGPRALGHRSILADPREKKMADIVNNRVKKRQPWRPFAPTILNEHAEDWLVDTFYSPFMSFTFEVRPEKKEMCGAVVHVDGTTRPQTLRREIEPVYYDLIQGFYDKTGVPMLLNTSFNKRGDPIVNSPEDALQTYFTSGMDVLVMENIVLRKKG